MFRLGKLHERITTPVAGAKCILCDTLITLKNRTKEHIIAESIGGNLQSPNVLCRLCNSKTGDRIDSDLAKSTLLVNLVQGRLSKSSRYIDVERYGTGVKLKLSGPNEAFVKDPVITEEEDGSLLVERPNDWPEERLKNYVHRWIDKNKPGQNFNYIDTGMREGKSVLDPSLYDPWFRRPQSLAVIKTAATFYTAVTHSKPSKHIVNIITDQGQGDLIERKLWTRRSALMATPAYYYQYCGANSDGSAIFHSLFLRADPAVGVMYVEVKLFNVHNFRVVLDYFYTGPRLWAYYKQTPFQPNTKSLNKFEYNLHSRRYLVRKRLWNSTVDNKIYNDRVTDIFSSLGVTWQELPPQRRKIKW